MTTIQSLAEALLQKNATVTGIALQIGGREVEREPGEGYGFVPADTRFRHAWLGVEADDERGRETPVDLELTVRPEANLRIAELERVFGTYRPVPPLPGGGKPFRIAFYYDPPDLPGEAAIFATLSDEPEKQQAHVTEILIRKDEPL